MKTNRPELSAGDRELCALYIEKMRREGLQAHEPWEHELEAWAADPARVPRQSTIRRLRIRLPRHEYLRLAFRYGKQSEANEHRPLAFF
jgi:hypothetical protein